MPRGTIFSCALMFLFATTALRAQSPAPAANHQPVAPPAADKPPRESVVASITGIYLPPDRDESSQVRSSHRVQAHNGMVFELDPSRYPGLKDYLDNRSLKPETPIRVLGWINPVSPAGAESARHWACTVQRLELIGPGPGASASASATPSRGHDHDTASSAEKLAAIHSAGGLTVSVPKVKRKDGPGFKARTDLYDRAKALTERAGASVKDNPFDRTSGRFFADLNGRRIDSSLLNSLDGMGVEVKPFPFPAPTLGLPQGESAAPATPARPD